MVDNTDFKHTARMSDGRAFTSYYPDCYVNNLIRYQNSPPGTLMNSYQYRLFLQQNSQALMDKERRFIERRSACCTGYYVDPNSNDRYWDSFKYLIGF